VKEMESYKFTSLTWVLNSLTPVVAATLSTSTEVRMSFQRCIQRRYGCPFKDVVIDLLSQG
jgi:hypothetical protein